MSWAAIGSSMASLVASQAMGGGGGGSPGVAGSGAGGGFADIFKSMVPMLQTGVKAYEFASPQGPVARGDVGGTLKSGMDLGGSVSNLFAPQQSELNGTQTGGQEHPIYNQRSGMGGIPTKIGGTGFGGLTPDVQKAILEILLGRN